MDKNDITLIVAAVVAAVGLASLSGIKKELKEMNRNLRKIRKCMCKEEPGEEMADHIDIVLDVTEEVNLKNDLKVKQAQPK